MPKGQQINAERKKRAFAQDIVAGKRKKQAYRDNIAYKDVTDGTASVESTRLLKDPIVKDEIARQVARITPENVLARIDRLAENGKPSDNVKLRALELLGNTQRASIFKDNQPIATYNTLNIIDVDDLRRRLAESSSKPAGELSTGTTPSIEAQ